MFGVSTNGSPPRVVPAIFRSSTNKNIMFGKSCPDSEPKEMRNNNRKNPLIFITTKILKKGINFTRTPMNVLTELLLQRAKPVTNHNFSSVAIDGI